MLKRLANMIINNNIYIDELPTDILLNIFKYLSCDDVIKLLIVNKTLNNFINNNNKYIEFNQIHNYNKNNIDNIVNLFPRIKLHINGKDHENYEYYINNIEEIVIFNNHYNPVDAKIIKNIPIVELSLSFNILNLDSLKDKDCKINTLRYCYTNLTDVSPFVNIKNLYLYCSTNLTDISPLKNYSFNILDLSLCSELKDITPLKHCNINKLILSYTAIEDVSCISHINNIRLRGCKKIKDFNHLSNVDKLNISGTLIKDVSCLKNNRYLDISNTLITNIDCLVNNKRLETINIIGLDININNIDINLICKIKKIY